MSRVSIALCTYNGENFLSEQLESFLRQTRLPDELVVCDDGSKDKTIEILKRFKSEAPFPVHVHINEKNLGSTKNFERAISLSTGDVIFLSDQDDVWLPEKIKTIMDAFDKFPDVGLIFTDAELVDENLKPLRKTLWDYSFPKKARRRFEQEESAFEILAAGMTVTGATMAFKAELKNLCLPMPAQRGFIHDGWISFITYAFYKILPLKAPLVKYRQHGNQQIGVAAAAKEVVSSIAAAESESARNSRYERYQKAIERETENKSRIEMLKRNYEIAVENASRRDPRFKRAARDPISFLDRIAQTAAQDISHLSFRRDLPANRISRIPQILSHLLGGNYHRFSRGARSAAFDFAERIS